MAAPDEKRAELLDRLADHILAEGLHASSLRPLAAAAGTSDRMLLYYFRDKGDLIASTLGHIMRRLEARLGALLPPEPSSADRLLEALFNVGVSEDLGPYMRLWLEIAALSARGDPVCRVVGEGIARGLLAWIGERLEDKGRALDVLVALEGRMVLHSVGLDEVRRPIKAL